MSNIEKNLWTNEKIRYKKWSKEIKSNNLFYCKVERSLTVWGAILEKLTIQEWNFFFRMLGVCNNIIFIFSIFYINYCIFNGIINDIFFLIIKLLCLYVFDFLQIRWLVVGTQNSTF